MECIHGDEGCDYLYSKSVLLKPLPWTEPLANLRDSITKATGYSFRIVIGNQYRSGQDSIGWHNDSEASMGLNPAIASISLGAVRTLSMVDTSLATEPTPKYLQYRSLEQLSSGELQQLLNVEAADCEELLDRPVDELTSEDWEQLRGYEPVAA